MAFLTASGVSISGIAAAVPVNAEFNSDLFMLDEREKNEIITKVGINSRRIAPIDICASDLCATAAKQLLQELNCSVDSIGILVFVTQTPDHLLPGNSMLIQQQLGLPASSLLIDLNQGCAGYVYGLATITGLMQAFGIKRGLLLVGDTISRLLLHTDRTTVPIFSDAGSATLIESSSTAPPMHFNIGADGSGFKTIHVQKGGARIPFTNGLMKANGESSHLAMEGLDVLNYSLKNVVPNIRQVLEYAQTEINASDHFIFHQANLILNENIRKRLGIEQHKVPETLSILGNTSSATIPVTIASRLEKELTDQKKKLLMCGFGAGFSWGSAIVETNGLTCLPLIEMHGRTEN